MNATQPSPYQKPDLHRSWLTPREFDFELYTDGSGHPDLFGGAAVYGLSTKYRKQFTRASAFYGADTDRAEFEALLAGLQGILDTMEWNSHLWKGLLEARRCTVFWLSDRESLVGSVCRDDKTGQPIYRRRNCPDLWARFAYYENLFDVQGVHRERNTHPFQKIADGISSECRTMMKNYFAILEQEQSK